MMIIVHATCAITHAYVSPDQADTMTIREAGTFRTEVANKLANPMTAGTNICVCVFISMQTSG